MISPNEFRIGRLQKSESKWKMEWGRNGGLERGIDSSGFTAVCPNSRREQAADLSLYHCRWWIDTHSQSRSPTLRSSSPLLSARTQSVSRQELMVDLCQYFPWWIHPTTIRRLISEYLQNHQSIFISYSRFNQEDQKEESNPDNTCHSDQVQDQMLSLPIHFGRRWCWQGWKVEGQFASRWVLCWNDEWKGNQFGGCRSWVGRLEEDGDECLQIQVSIPRASWPIIKFNLSTRINSEIKIIKWWEWSSEGRSGRDWWTRGGRSREKLSWMEGSENVFSIFSVMEGSKEDIISSQQDYRSGRSDLRGIHIWLLMPNWASLELLLLQTF